MYTEVDNLLSVSKIVEDYMSIGFTKVTIEKLGDRRYRVIGSY